MPGSADSNLTHRIENGKLIIEIDLNVEGNPSSSGKTTVIASSHGNMRIDVPGHQPMFLGLNLFEYRNDRQRQRPRDDFDRDHDWGGR